MASLLSSLPFGKALATIFACGLVGAGCFASSTGPSVSIATSGNPAQTVVVTSINGQEATTTFAAPYGVASSVVVTGTSTEATTTPLTAADVETMQAQFAQQQQDMEQLFADQQRMFQDLWNNFN